MGMMGTCHTQSSEEEVLWEINMGRRCGPKALWQRQHVSLQYCDELWDEDRSQVLSIGLPWTRISRWKKTLGCPKEG